MAPMNRSTPLQKRTIAVGRAERTATSTVARSLPSRIPVASTGQTQRLTPRFWSNEQSPQVDRSPYSFWHSGRLRFGADDVGKMPNATANGQSAMKPPRRKLELCSLSRWAASCCDHSGSVAVTDYSRIVEACSPQSPFGAVHPAGCIRACYFKAHRIYSLKWSRTLLGPIESSDFSLKATCPVWTNSDGPRCSRQAP